MSNEWRERATIPHCGTTVARWIVSCRAHETVSIAVFKICCDLPPDSRRNFYFGNKCANSITAGECKYLKYFYLTYIQNILKFETQEKKIFSLHASNYILSLYIVINTSTAVLIYTDYFKEQLKFE